MGGFMYRLGVAAFPIVALGGIAVFGAYSWAFYDRGREAARLIALRTTLAVTAGILLAWTLSIRNPDSGRSINLIPLREITRSLHSLDSTDAGYGVVNFWGNILVFVPLGVLLVLAKPWGRRPAWPMAVATGAAFSSGIEILQFSIGRTADIDDVILNTLGVIVGATIAFPFYRARRIASDRIRSATA